MRCYGDLPRLGGLHLHIADEAVPLLIKAADGDARRMLTFVEILADLAEQGSINLQQVREVVSQGHRRFDNKGDIFYEQISALHKSVRGSDPDAALYWLCRMLDGGCDPLYVARRVLRMASEDIGNRPGSGLSGLRGQEQRGLRRIQPGHAGCRQYRQPRGTVASTQCTYVVDEAARLWQGLSLCA